MSEEKTNDLRKNKPEAPTPKVEAAPEPISKQIAEYAEVLAPLHERGVNFYASVGDIEGKELYIAIDVGDRRFPKTIELAKFKVELEKLTGKELILASSPSKPHILKTVIDTGDPKKAYDESIRLFSVLYNAGFTNIAHTSHGVIQEVLDVREKEQKTFEEWVRSRGPVLNRLTVVTGVTEEKEPIVRLKNENDFDDQIPRLVEGAEKDQTWVAGKARQNEPDR